MRHGVQPAEDHVVEYREGADSNEECHQRPQPGWVDVSAETLSEPIVRLVRDRGRMVDECRLGLESGEVRPCLEADHDKQRDGQPGAPKYRA